MKGGKKQHEVVEFSYSALPINKVGYFRKTWEPICYVSAVNIFLTVTEALTFPENVNSSANHKQNYKEKIKFACNSISTNIFRTGLLLHAGFSV